MEIKDISEINTKDKNEVASEIYRLINLQNELIDDIFINKKNLSNEERKESEYECKLWLETDFKAKKCSNKEMREAYVNNEMKDFISRKDEYKRNIKLAESQHSLYATMIRILSVFLEDDINDS